MDDLLALAGLIVNAMVPTVEELLEAPGRRGAGRRRRSIRIAEKQLRLITLGVTALAHAS